MGIAQTIALNWRAITAFVMAGVQLAVALGLLPVGSEETANTLIATAGGVIAVIAGGSYVQNIATTRAIAATANAAAEGTKAVRIVAEREPSAVMSGQARRAGVTADHLADLAGRQPR